MLVAKGAGQWTTQTIKQSSKKPVKTNKAVLSNQAIKGSRQAARG